MNPSSRELALGISFLLLGAIFFALHVYAVVHCCKRRQGRSRMRWILVILLVPAIGPILSLLAARTRTSAPPTPALSAPPTVPVNPPILNPIELPGGAAAQDEQQRVAAISDSIAALARSSRRSTTPGASTVDRFDQPPRIGSGGEFPPSLVGALASLNDPSRAERTATANKHPTTPPASKLLVFIFFISGALMLWLSIAASANLPHQPNISFRIGNVIGVMSIWPLIIVGLFSIGRRFRSTRARIIIVLVVWGISALGEFGNMSQRAQQSRNSGPLPSRPQFPNTNSPAATVNTNGAVATNVSIQTAPAPALAERPTTNFDFSPGSDERLAQTIESAREDRYRAIVTAYAHACESRAKDAVLALERVRFIERFAFAEDSPIEAAEHDREVAATWLTSRFPDAPGTILHQLDHKYGAEFQTAAATYENAATRWPREDYAKFLLLRAQRATDKAEQHNLARRSFAANATLDAGVLFLAGAGDPGQRKEALGLLDHPVFKAPGPWQKKQIVEFLFDAGEDKRAMALYDELRAGSPALVHTADIATRLANNGHVPAAREILSNLPDSEWNRASRLRERFEFELKYGNAQQASDAYRAMCANNIKADLFLRDRFSLFLKHPSSGWSFRDLPRLILTAILGVVVGLAPAVLLLPVHYWSLLRARQSKSSSWANPKWGLREIWVALGVLLVGQVVAVWLFMPDQLQAQLHEGGKNVAGTKVTDGALLATQLLAWAVMAVVLLVAFARARAWKVIGPGDWKLGRIVGVGLACTLGLHVALGCYALIWPHALNGELGSLPSMTRRLSLVLLNDAGPAGLIAAVAVLVPVLEELFFRGVLLQGLAKHIPFGWANTIQAMLFAASHENWHLFPFFLLFGATCGWVARRSGGLLPGIVIHALNNLSVCIGYIAKHH